MDVSRVIRDSYGDARKALVLGTSPDSLVRARERAFVKALAANVEAAHTADDLRVFYPFSRGIAADFGGESLLHDIEVCRVAFGETAARKPQPFAYITSALWQIAIELSHDWRQMVYAFNRLNGGGADNKLLIGAQGGDQLASLIQTLQPVAAAGAGVVYLALIPHPRAWDDDDAAPAAWRMEDGEWRALP